MNFLESTIKQFEKAIRTINLGKDLRKKIEEPENILSFEIKIKKESGQEVTLPAWRVQHNSLLGPYKGGIRFHPESNLEEVKALAMLMSLKCSLLNLPLGGGKGAVKVDVTKFSQTELEKISREYVRHIYQHIGEDKDVPAPDVSTNEKVMSWMIDEYEKLIGRPSPATFTGKPIDLKGSLMRREATGWGGGMVVTELIKTLKKKSEKITVAVHGFGNAGSEIARFLFDRGYKIVAISDSSGGLENDQGLNIPSIIEQLKGNIKVNQLSFGKKISNSELLAKKVDILILAALENSLTLDNADDVKAKIIVEIANGPINLEAEKILLAHKAIILPDILANAGGVTVSYFEWLQNKKNQHWSKEEVYKKLDKKMKAAFKEVWNLGRRERIDLREASYILAIERIIKKIDRSKAFKEHVPIFWDDITSGINKFKIRLLKNKKNNR